MKVFISILWAIITIVLVYVSIFYTYKLSFLQFKIKNFFKCFKDKKSFSSFCLTLGARIGVGSLSGIALSIYLGGVGTIFWIIIISLIASIISYVESILGVLSHKNHHGSPSYYIEKFLHKKRLAIIFSILLFALYIICFVPIQANTIVKSINDVTNINNYLILFFLIIISINILFKNSDQIIKLMTYILPIMSIIYLGIGIVIIITNITIIPEILLRMIQEAFTSNGLAGGVLGTIIIGIQRGIFASEVGLGTSSISASLTDNPHSSGIVQILGVHFTTIFICLVTSIIIILSDYQTHIFNNINGIEITLYAFKYHFGNLGSYALLVITFLFAISTIISAFYYGEVAFFYIFKKNYHNQLIYQIIIISMLTIGGLINSDILWDLSNIITGLLSIINLTTIYQLRDIVLKQTKKYFS